MNFFVLYIIFVICEFGYLEDEGEVKNQCPLIPQTKKGKRTRRSPKKFITKLSLGFCKTEGTVTEDNETERVSFAEHCENSSDGLCSEVVQGNMFFFGWF